MVCEDGVHLAGAGTGDGASVAVVAVAGAHLICCGGCLLTVHALLAPAQHRGAEPGGQVIEAGVQLGVPS